MTNTGSFKKAQNWGAEVMHNVLEITCTFQWWIVFLNHGVFCCALKELFAVSVDCSKILRDTVPFDDRRLNLWWPNRCSNKIKKKVLNIFQCSFHLLKSELCVYKIPSHFTYFPFFKINSCCHTLQSIQAVCHYYCPSTFSFALTNLDKF